MATEPTNTTIVTEERRRRGILPWIAGAAAIALLGGSTYALWSVTGDFEGGAITAGNLAVDTTSSGFYDVTADRLDQATGTIPELDDVPAHKILDITRWRIVPGDTVAMVMTADVTLEGDNLVAELTVSGLEELASDFGEGVLGYEYQVIPNGGDPTVKEDLEEDTVLATFASPRTNQEDGQPAYGAGVITATAGVTTDVTVIVYVTFSEDVEGTDATQAVATLADAGLTLTQVLVP